ncbi:MAG: hypothetical protein KIT84_23995 [Labilithrix sp.]|nr:hypothetical protein [Labilithrix sp.]MCW5814112.1 hypothetical protein [Labilithrix sp.]
MTEYVRGVGHLRWREPDPTPPPDAAPASPPTVLERLPSAREDAVRDAMLAAAARNATAGPPPPPNDRILYLGLNPSAAAESAALAADVTIAVSGSSIVACGGKDHDLATDVGVHSFAAALAAEHGLSPAQRTTVTTVLKRADPIGRDELARLALAWAPAERGASVPSRLVISGHSMMGHMYNDAGTAAFNLQDVRDLARAFPRAAEQIEDVHVGGCYSENEVQDPASWRGVFQHVKTIWGYGGFSPLGPVDHMKAWKTATAGRAESIDKNVLLARAPATAWTKSQGVIGETVSLEKRRENARDADDVFADLVSGKIRVTHAHQPNAERAYDAYGSVAAHRNADPAERARAAERQGQVFRIRFWEQSVRAQVARAYGAAIDEAMTTAGLPKIDVATATRKELMDAFEALRAKTGALPPLLDRIAKLDPRVIDHKWCV